MPDINEVGAEAWLAEVRDRGGTTSAGPIVNFVTGWAVVPFVGELAHYWRPNNGFDRAIGPRGVNKIWRSLCQLVGGTSEQVPALGVGNKPRCKHCRRQAHKLRLV